MLGSNFRIQFINEFSAPDRSLGDKRRGKNEVRCDKPLEPSAIYEVLPMMKSAENLFLHGRQEDAEEFLTCVLNTLHEEITEAIKQNKEAKGTHSQPENCQVIVPFTR